MPVVPGAVTEAAGAERRGLLPWVAAAVRVGLGALFLYAAVLKIADPMRFAEAVANYRLLPGALVPAAAAALPGVELGVAACLLAGLWGRAAALVVAALMAVFTAATVQALARGIDLRCGCFGASSDPVTLWTVARDVALVGAAAFVTWADRGTAGLDRWIGRFTSRRN